MAKSYEKDMRSHGFSRTEVDHHTDGSHSVRHYPIAKSSKSGAFISSGEPHSYAAEDGDQLLAKVGDKLGIEPTEETEEDA